MLFGYYSPQTLTAIQSSLSWTPRAPPSLPSSVLHLFHPRSLHRSTRTRPVLFHRTTATCPTPPLQLPGRGRGRGGGATTEEISVHYFIVSHYFPFFFSFLSLIRSFFFSHLLISKRRDHKSTSFLFIYFCRSSFLSVSFLSPSLTRHKTINCWTWKPQELAGCLSLQSLSALTTPNKSSLSGRPSRHPAVSLKHVFCARLAVLGTCKTWHYTTSRLLWWQRRENWLVDMNCICIHLRFVVILPLL